VSTVATTPLAERLRPKSLDTYIGQQHLVGKGAVLRNSIDSGLIPSIILWGPPGVGKTTLASIISQTLKRPFYILSAINSGVKDVREAIQKAEKSQTIEELKKIMIDKIKSQWKTILKAFRDFNKDA